MKSSRLYIAILATATLSLILSMNMPVRSCDIAVVSAHLSTNGRPFIWKNYDNSQSYQQQIKYFSQVGAGGGYIILFYHNEFSELISGDPTTAQAGVNETGLAMAVTSVYEDLTNPINEAGNMNVQLMLSALQTCTNLADFDDFLMDVWPMANPGHAISGNFVVIDAQGGAALYELYTGQATVTGIPTILTRKHDANTGIITDQTGAQVGVEANDGNFYGFVNATNSHYWLPDNAGSERKERATTLLTNLATKSDGYTQGLNPQSMMRVVSKDINGKQVTTAPDSIHTYSTTYCISRSATRSGTVIEGVPEMGNVNLTTFWCALGEPSIACFVPYFIAAKGVSYLAYIDSISADGTWNDLTDSSLLTDAEDTHETYNDLLYTSNRGDIIWGPYANFINLDELTAEQTAWMFPIEDIVYQNTVSFLNNAANITQAGLKEFSDYCAQFTYDNYTHASSTYSSWAYATTPTPSTPDDTSNSSLSPEPQPSDRAEADDGGSGDSGGSDSSGGSDGGGCFIATGMYHSAG